jgi:hypothetical protein
MTNQARRVWAGLLGLALLGAAGCSDTLGVDPNQVQGPAGDGATHSQRVAYGISTSPSGPVPGISPTPRP